MSENVDVSPMLCSSCPTSTTTEGLTKLPLSLLFPELLTGIGAIATMQVNPSGEGYDWDGLQFKESVVQTSSSCPTNWTICTTAEDRFVVGNGGQAVVDVNGKETPFGPTLPAEENIFYDQHTATAANSALGSGSCFVECTQTYYCGTQQVGSHVITYTFSAGTENGTAVTNVAVSKN